MFAAALVHQHFAVMSYRPKASSSVVVHMPDLAAAAGVSEVGVGEAVVITFDMVIAIRRSPAGRLLLREVRRGRNHRPASSGVRRVI
jgi:hypothetical protein